MTLNDATQEYTNSERARLLRDAARFNGCIDKTVDGLENKINEILTLQAELYALTEESEMIDEKELNNILGNLDRLGVKPSMDMMNQRYYS